MISFQVLKIENVLTNSKTNGWVHAKLRDLKLHSGPGIFQVISNHYTGQITDINDFYGCGPFTLEQVAELMGDAFNEA
jgi:hypothetical protein